MAGQKNDDDDDDDDDDGVTTYCYVLHTTRINNSSCKMWAMCMLFMVLF